MPCLPLIRFPMPRPPFLHPPSRSKPFSLAFAALAWFSLVSGVEAQTPIPDTNSGGNDATKPIFEEWVLVVLDGKTCGFGSTVTTKTDTPTGPYYLTAHQEQFLVKRLGTSLKITETSKVTEDADGSVLSFDQVDD